MTDPHFDAVAGDYDRLRTSGGQWQALADRTLASLAKPRRLLDIGSGTGRFAVYAAEQLGARVWAVEPSAAMLERARSRPGGERVGWRQASVEALPFKDGWFDAAHVHLVMHLVEDRPVALAQLSRVLSPRGRVAIVTFHLDHFEQFYLNDYFPSIPAIDLARFPDPATLADELVAAGFGDTAVERISTPACSRGADVLERVRGRYISTLSVVSADEYQRGLARLERDVHDGREEFEFTLEWALITATREP
jgi:SAM-dependent methyltransferase